ncbi:hypothetical protein TNCV_4492281 [Trichonephila clavipes]|nr:hypothetical protein TNCV_4492281 [Trichonephila clavipes]
MVLRERKGTIDGYEWRCRTKGGENPHHSMNEFAVKDVRLNKNTVVDWYMFCREVCVVEGLKESEPLGGEGKIVEIDESMFGKMNQLASLDKNNALQEIKLRLSYLQGKSTTMSVIAHQTEKEWISANEKSRQRMSQTQAEGAAKQHAARLQEAHLRAHHSCFITKNSTSVSNMTLW